MYGWNNNWTKEEIEDYIKRREKRTPLVSLYADAGIFENNPCFRVKLLFERVLELKGKEQEEISQYAQSAGKVNALLKLEKMVLDKY